MVNTSNNFIGCFALNFTFAWFLCYSVLHYNKSSCIFSECFIDVLEQFKLFVLYLV